MRQGGFTIHALAMVPILGMGSVQRPTAVNHSYSRPEEAIVSHIDLDLTVDFETRKISGKASLQFENLKAVSVLSLDTSALTIQRVTLGEKEEEAKFRLGETDKILGRPLIIEIRPDSKLVNIYYETSPDASALQWLTPSQTAGGKMPFLFTMSQPILARSWMPCQDTPSVRTTYNAKVKVPAGMMAVMSAENPKQKNPRGTYEFKMPQAVPSYLFALAVGDLSFQSLGKKSGVYAEPSVLKSAAWEFADTEKMIRSAEKLYGEYRWGRYDILVLPPSFPFGGMENPRLTFATPTIITGDRSLVSVIAHELSHSWSGNLVTNATWDDFWLNEGFTTNFERRILEAIYGKERADMEAALDYRELEKTISDPKIPDGDKKLKLKLKGRDPDDGVSDIAYFKGSFFLQMIEEAVGREKWDAFLKKYFTDHAFQSMTTEGFVTHLNEELIKGDVALKQKLQIDAWIYGPSLPSNAPKPTSEALALVDQAAESWIKGTPAKKLGTSKWVTAQWMRFIRNLPDKLTLEQMRDLDQAFKLTESHNAEIATDWFLKAIKNQYNAAYPAVEEFLLHVGRRKFIKPIYEALASTPEGLGLAQKIYAKARSGYHPVSTGSIDGIVKWTP